MSERLIPKVCEQCASAFDGRKAQRFCSRPCAARHTNNIREANPKPRPEACGEGHPFTEDNTYTTRDGRRICRECKRARERDVRRKTGKRPPAPRPVKAAPVPVVASAAATWRPSAPGWALRPGDAGYNEEMAS